MSLAKNTNRLSGTSNINSGCCCFLYFWMHGLLFCCVFFVCLICILMVRWMAFISFLCILQMSCLGACKFGELSGCKNPLKGHTLKNAGLNTTQHWVKYGQTQWIGLFLTQWLGYCPEGWVKHLTQSLGLSIFNPAFFRVHFALRQQHMNVYSYPLKLPQWYIYNSELHSLNCRGLQSWKYSQNYIQLI